MATISIDVPAQHPAGEPVNTGAPAGPWGEPSSCPGAFRDPNDRIWKLTVPLPPDFRPPGRFDHYVGQGEIGRHDDKIRQLESELENATREKDRSGDFGAQAAAMRKFTKAEQDLAAAKKDRLAAAPVEAQSQPEHQPLPKKQLQPRDQPKAAGATTGVEG